MDSIIIYAKEQVFLTIVFIVMKSCEKKINKNKIFCIAIYCKWMVYRDTRIVSFYIAIYQYTGNIAHP